MIKYYIFKRFYEKYRQNFIGACCGMPLGIVGIATGSIFALIFNKIIGKEK